MMPNSTTSPAAGDLPVRHTEHDDGSTTIVVDFGAHGDDIHVDIVDDTLLAVHERPAGADESFELELPSGGASTFIKNGVLTIEVSA